MQTSAVNLCADATRTLESAIRSRRFKLDDYAFDARASVKVDANRREVASK
jgi:hypothetical protein